MKVNEWEIVRARTYKGRFTECNVCGCKSLIFIITLKNREGYLLRVCSECAKNYSSSINKINKLVKFAEKVFANRSKHLEVLDWEIKDFMTAEKLLKQIECGQQFTLQHIHNFTIYNVWHKSKYNRWIVYVNFSNGNCLEFDQEFYTKEDAQLAVYDFSMQNEVNKIVKYYKG